VDAFEGFILTQLGQPFLRRYYSAVLDYPKRLFIVAEQGGRLLGFAAGFADPCAFSRMLRRRALRLLPSIMLGVLTHPRVLGVVAQNALGVVCGRHAGYEPDAGDAELASLGVAPGEQGHGLGRLLIRGFVDAAGRAGSTGVHLSTDAEDNERVNRFYSSLGFNIETTYMAAGNRRRNHYRLPLR
jgi:ribosomal protein S18 acetylase RimI-like enzyme